MKNRFAIALNELVGMCEDDGLESRDMIPALKDTLLMTKRNPIPSKFDDEYNAKRTDQ